MPGLLLRGASDVPIEKKPETHGHPETSVVDFSYYSVTESFELLLILNRPVDQNLESILGVVCDRHVECCVASSIIPNSRRLLWSKNR